MVIGQFCFVISPFGDPFDAYYDEIYQPAITKAGLQPRRVDEIFKPGVFMQDVYEGIVSSVVALADVTGRNANVFYELGLAHALSKPVVMVAQRNEDVPADLESVRFVRYDVTRPRWDTKLESNIVAALQAALTTPAILPFRSPSPKTAAERLATVSGTQKKIFDYLRGQPSWVGLRSLVSHFKQPDTELYYRLEQLRLLGLIEPEPGSSSNSYRLTVETRTQLEAGSYAT
jgi:hypothetical protein